MMTPSLKSEIKFDLDLDVPECINDGGDWRL
jgi:hypothetical protein